MSFRDFEQEQRERVLRYQRKNQKRLRDEKRNKYRLAHNIPLDAPVTHRETWKPIEDK